MIDDHNFSRKKCFNNLVQNYILNNVFLATCTSKSTSNIDHRGVWTWCFSPTDWIHPYWLCHTPAKNFARFVFGRYLGKLWKVFGRSLGGLWGLWQTVDFCLWSLTEKRSRNLAPSFLSCGFQAIILMINLLICSNLNFRSNECSRLLWTGRS